MASPLSRLHLPITRLLWPRLTERQAYMLHFIRRYRARVGYPPTVREIARAMGTRNTSAVHAHLLRLARKGYLQRDPTARGLVLR